MVLVLASFLFSFTACTQQEDTTPQTKKDTAQHAKTEAQTQSVAPIAPERPTDAQLHAYKAKHHADYLKVTAADAGGTNKLIHTTVLPTEGTDPVVTPALDHLYTKAVIDLTSGPVVLEVPDVPKERYFSIHITDQEHYTIYDKKWPVGKYVFVRKGYTG
ncbi:MAG: DUF1254 domain-containing protein, partial [Deltaproteobacteria bacterium]|nr:DUF1254 domain-containing protein [Deltaproteobacteria bacterium]